MIQTSGSCIVEETRNVMFIVIDQLRADVLTGALAEPVELPNLRALMQEAVTFGCNFSVINPCGPARASILTGQYGFNHRSIRNGAPLRHDTPTLASEARKAGYTPLLFGYTDTSQDPRVYADDDIALTTYEHPMTGFQEEVEMRSEESKPWREDLSEKGYDLPTDFGQFYVPIGQPGQPLRINDPAIYHEEDSDTAFLTNACLEGLRARVGERWFCHLTYIRPHPPLVAPKPYNRMYSTDAMPHPVRLGTIQDEKAMHPFFDTAIETQRPGKAVKGFGDLDDDAETSNALRSVYLGLASEVDTHIGRIVAFLKQSGQYDNTFLVVTSDHGEMLGDRYTWGKSTVYDAAFHTPLIIRDPDNASAHGNQIHAPTEAIDLTPTILNWIGRDIPSSMDGLSLMPFLRGDDPQWRDHSYSELDLGNPLSPTIWQKKLGLGPDLANVAILRGPRFTLVHFNGGLAPLLFDHEGDGEMRNVASEPDMAPVLLEMTRKILNHRMTNSDATLATTMITKDGAVQGTRRGPVRKIV